MPTTQRNAARRRAVARRAWTGSSASCRSSTSSAFPNYFLIVWDFVRYAREKGIPATARGSGVGSLVCYALYLSHVCPIKYDLLFERFLDESRKEAPDIDIDFCKDRRGESSTTSRKSTAKTTSPRSARSARWPPGRRSATSAARWACRLPRVDHDRGHGARGTRTSRWTKP